MFEWLADLVVWQILRLTPAIQLGQAVHFFVGDVVKIFTLLALIIFLVAVVRSFFPVERTRKILSHRCQYLGNLVAALLGVATPF